MVQKKSRFLCDLCPTHIIIQRERDTINNNAMRYSSLMRFGQGQSRFINNTGGNINRTYQEPLRNKF